MDGLVDAEPLYVGGLAINGVQHNVLFVATENDSLYAFDADTFSQLWQTPLLSGTNEVPSDDRGCGQVEPQIGITSTPEIDLTAGPHGTIFVVAMTKAGTTYHQRLHALDLTTGADLTTATDIQASAAGSGTGNSGGTQTFVPESYEERAALLLLNGAIYTTWASHCDAPNYTSWAISFSESTLQKVSVLNLTANVTSQNGQEGGVWMSGNGPAADASLDSSIISWAMGHSMVHSMAVGFLKIREISGNSFMKLSTSGNNLAVTDYFAMNNSQGTAENGIQCGYRSRFLVARCSFRT